MISKVILTAGITLLVCISAWSLYNIRYHSQVIMSDVAAEIDRLNNTIRLGTHYAMMLNSREDIRQIIMNICKQKGIENVRIYTKSGRIAFSNTDIETGNTTDIREKACYVCHRSDPPLTEADLPERTRIFRSPKGYRLIGVMSSIHNEPSCASAACHVHPEGKTILGLIDVVVSLETTDRKMSDYRKNTILMGIFIFAATFISLVFFIWRFIKHPIRKLMVGVRDFTANGQLVKVDVPQEDEIGELAAAFNKMMQEIVTKQVQLDEQKNEYQRLFENVPCIITVQDKNFRMLKYNDEFVKRFNPAPGDFCFHAYKGLNERCENCLVEKAFEDGESHSHEEAMRQKNGEETYWYVTASPIRNANGEIVAVMEISLDITMRRQLEEKLEQTKKKYLEIFNNIPDSLFVVDMDTFEVLECNEHVKATYGYSKWNLIGRSFLDMFLPEDKEYAASRLRALSSIDQVGHVTKEGKTIFVAIRVSPSDYPGRRVFLVATRDITKMLEAEQQLMQAAKMATLGQMSTGVAHELNQPLSVLRTISSFFMRKLKRSEPIDHETFSSMVEGVNRHVERAAKIIDHMREFGRRSDLQIERVQINDVLKRSCEMFIQQLNLRNINVEWELEDGLPVIMNDAGRIEQVFVNLIINARDAIEEKWQGRLSRELSGKIILKTYSKANKIVIEVSDTGTGFSKDVEEKLFEPFFTTKKVGKGTGLGLSISYRIIQDYRGTIHAINNEYGGATFIIEFPVMEASDKD
ncbi:MAG: PAS domain S-box protein [Pseudomonadota bacterium]